MRARFFPTLAGGRAPASPISPAASMQKIRPLLNLEFSFCHPLSSSGSRQQEAAALHTKPALFLCYVTIWAFRLVFLDIGRCVKYWNNPVVYMESRLALSGGCTMLVFSLNTRACSIVKATLQQSPGKQGEKTLTSWPGLWNYSRPGQLQHLIRMINGFAIAFTLTWSFS